MKIDPGFRILACFMLINLVACRDKDNDEKQNPAPPSSPVGAPMSPPFDPLGEVKVGNVKLFMPFYFGTGIWPLRIYGPFDFTVSTVLENGPTKSAVLVRTRIENKACDPAKEAQEFIQEGLNLISLGTDSIATKDWTSESEVFKGKSFYRTQYERGNEIQHYRFSILLANEKTSECISWNIEINPYESMSSSFVEGSNEFIVLQQGFAKTWTGIGAAFELIE